MVDRVEIDVNEGPAVEEEVYVFPASFAQERLWFLANLEPNSSAYNCHRMFRLHGDFRLPLLEESLRLIIDRHEALRTSFRVEGGEAVQIVHPSCPWSMSVADLFLEPAADLERRAMELGRLEANRPFDLGKAPLLRVHALRLGEAATLLVFSQHHIVTDGGSMNVLIREISAVYDALRRGEPVVLPDLPIQYADFSVWQRERAAGPGFAADLRFWLSRLADAPRVLALPFDHPRRSGEEGALGVAKPATGLSESGRRRFLELLQSQGATEFMGLLAAFEALVMRWTGQEDFVLGTAVSGRTSVETEGLIGFFVNMLALRAKPSSALGFGGHLAEVRTEVIEAFAHQETPFSKLVEALRSDREQGQTPLFQAIFALERRREAATFLADSEWTPIESRADAAKFDLNMTVSVHDGLHFFLDYRRDLFEPATMIRLVDHLVRLVEEVAVAPDAPLGSLNLMAAPERHQLLVEWTDREREIPDEVSLFDLFAQEANRREDAVALVWQDRVLTYGEVLARATALSDLLREKGVGPEVGVALLSERSPEMVIALLGILAAGGFYVPLDPSYPPARLAEMLEESRAPVILTKGRRTARLSAMDAVVIPLDDALASKIASSSGRRNAPSTGGAGTAYVMFTSGSTGRPKGVRIPHRGVIRLVKETDFARISESEVFLQAAPTSFDASTLEIWGPLLNGGRLVLYEEDEMTAEGLLRSISRHGITVLWLTAGLFHHIVEARIEALSGVGQLLAGGDVLLPVLVEKMLRDLPDTRLINGYGPTEGTTFTCCHSVLAPPPPGETVPIGRPIANSWIRVLDQKGRPVSVGTFGELYIGGAGLAIGYLGEPSLSAEKFVPDPEAVYRGDRLYRTGDLVRWRADGTVEFAGRIDSQVKLRGFRVEPGEIESLLVRHAAVREAAVGVVEDSRSDKRLVAFVVAEGGPQVEAEIFAYLRDNLPHYMVPSRLVWLAQLPKNPNGKVDRKTLLALPLDESPSAVTDAEAETPLSPGEAVMAEIWAEILGRERIGRRSNFFDLGGHSLQAMQVISRVRSVFGVELPMRSLFEEETLSALAAAVEELRRADLGAGVVRLPPLEPMRRPPTVPLSFAQQRLWFLDQLAPGSSAYNVSAGWSLAGRLRFAALEDAVTELVRRHESLRTTFHPSGEGPYQVISGPIRARIPVADLSGLSAEDREAETRSLVAQQAERSFDLVRGPLLRAGMLRLAVDENVALLTMHHIVSDGWSMAIMGREISALEGAFTEGAPSRLPDLPVQYADYALWQRRVLSEGALRAEVEHWRERLAGAPPVANLPLDRPRPLDGSEEGAIRRLVLAPGLSAELRALGRRKGATLFMVLLAGFQALLARFTGEPDVSVGTPVAGRTRLEIEGLIGFFVNTLVLRTRMHHDPSFDRLVDEVREITLDAHAHQDVPFEELVEKLQPDRSLAVSPLFQVMFSVQNNAPWGHGLAGLEARAADIDQRTAKFDLGLSVQEGDDGLLLTLEYGSRLFDPGTALRLLQGLERLLASAARDADSPVTRLAVSSFGELHQLAHEWNDRSPSPWQGAVHERIADRARQAPDAIALVLEDRALSYGALWERVEVYAGHLRDLGVGAESVVAVCLERSETMIAALLGVLASGGAYLPLDPAYPPERLDLLLADSGARAVVSEESVAARLPFGDWKTMLVDSLPAAPAGGGKVSPIARETIAGQLAYLIYTSGSTGRPKAVMGVHGALANYVGFALRDYGFSASDRVLQFASISFDASAEEIFPTLVAGGTLVLRHEEGAPEVAELQARCAREQLTVLDLPTAYWHEIAEAGDGVLGPSDSLRLVIIGGERALPERVARWCRTTGGRSELINTYGPTEATIVATRCRLDQAAAEATISIGVPVDGARVYVVSHRFESLPLGAGGELAIGGVGLARGYLGRPGLTAERFAPDPFSRIPGARMYLTGDRVRWTADGRLDFLGRIDFQVKIRGYRIELGEIEAALSEYPLVRDAVVIAREDVSGRPRLIAYFVPQEGAAPTAVELRGFLQEMLPAYMLPSAFVGVEAFPLTIGGKVDRQALPEPGGERTVSSVQFVAPRTPIEEVLALIWSELLRIDRVGIHDNFFELGGHSLLATQVVSRVRNVLEIEVPVRAVFERPTLSGMAQAVESARRITSGPQIPPLEPIDREPHGPGLPLSFAQQRLWFIDQFEPRSPLYNMPLRLAARGELKVDVLIQALREVRRRHEVLRTVFRSVEGRPTQVITEGFEVPGPIADLAGLAAEDRATESVRRMDEDALRPFDLATGPVMRLHLLRLAGDEHVVLFDMHHIATDGWSSALLMKEVGVLYAAYAAGLPSPLPELLIQYADFAVWQRRWLDGEALEDRLSFWRESLAGLAPMELPTDRSRTQRAARPGGAVRRVLSSEPAARLTRLASEERVTPFMTLLAAFQALLGRYSGQVDLAVGTPVAGRNRQEIEELIGFFVNLLVLRADLSGRPTVRESLARVRQRTLLAYAHQELPFERLVELLDPDREGGRPPLFQALFSFNRAGEQGATLDLPEVSLSTIPSPGAVKFDLALDVDESAGEFGFSFVYDRDLFDRATIERLGDHLTALIDAWAEQRHTPVDEISLVTAREAHQLLVEWNPGAPVSESLTLDELFAAQAARTPDRTASISRNAAHSTQERLTYRELSSRSRALADRLVSLGAVPDSRIAVLLSRGSSLLPSILGILESGAAYLPIDPETPESRIAFLLDDAEAAIVVTERAFLSRLPAGRRVLLVEEADAAPSPPPVRPRRRRGPASPDNLAYVLYTSGSTGRPKGVSVTHRNAAGLFAALDRHFPAQGVWLASTSVAFDISVVELLWTLSRGFTVVVAEGQPGGGIGLGSAVDRYGITHLEGTPSRAQMLLLDPDEAAALGRIDSLLLAGEALSPALAEALFAAGVPEVWNLYGPTETTIYATACKVLPGARISIGRPVENGTAYVLDGGLRPAPVGVLGELFIGGGGVARGYFGRPDLTAERFCPDPFGGFGERLYRTGDLARWLPEGGLEFLGRADHQVKVRGYRIEPGEIEATLAAHPEMRGAAVVVRDDLPGGRGLVAFVAADTDLSATLRTWLQQRLPPYMTPALFVTLDALPLSVSGKVDRRALATAKLPSGSSGPQGRGPRGLAEEMIALIWAEVLGLGRIGPHDNFFELGGHSLLATQVVARIRKAFSVELPLRRLFDSPTVAGLAEEIERAGPAEMPPIERMPHGAILPLSFAQQRLWFLDRLEPGSGAYNVPMAFRLGGAVFPAALVASLDELVRRHEILRTTFPDTGGEPIQRIAPDLPARLPRVDLRGIASERREITLGALVAAEAERPFDLAQGPPFRASILSLDERDWALLLVQHHIVTDAWSLGLMMGELLSLYRSFAAGQPPSLPDLPIRYADYAAWQRRWLAGEVLESKLAYWRRQLADLPVLELPTDRPRPAQRRYLGATASFVLPAALSEALAGLGRREGTTTFITLLAGLQALISCYCGEPDLAIGSPVSNRRRVELEPVLGFFVNTLVLRSNPASGRPFIELLARARETALEAFAHQDVPFEQLVEELQPPRDPSRTPLFQILMVFDAGRKEMISLPGLSASPLEIGGSTAKFDLTFGLSEEDGPGSTLRGTVEYLVDLFDRETIVRLWEKLERLFASVVAEPEKPVSALSLTSEAERRQLIRAGSGQILSGPGRGACLHQLFAAQAAATPHRIAVTRPGRESVTYGELLERVRILAGALRRRGVGPEVVVGLYAERSIEMVAGLLAILEAGGAYLPLDPAYPRERLVAMVEDSRSAAILAPRNLKAEVEELSGGIPVIWLGEGEDFDRPAEAAGGRQDVVDEANLAYLIYTSGSTGRPKGVAVEHRSAVALARWARATFSDEELSGVLFSTSVAFDLSVFELLVPLAWGGRSILVASALDVLSLPSEAEVRLVNTVPSVLAELLEVGPLPEGVRTVALAGEALPRTLAERIGGLGTVERILNLYGPSEDTTYSTFCEVVPGQGAPPIGGPIAGTSAFVVSRDLAPLPSGWPGELVLAGAGLARGYLHRPDLTAERFLPDPFAEAPGSRLYRTGDRVRADREGQLEFLGRFDRQVKIRGFRIELEEIETVLGKHPAVRMAAVLVRDDLPGGRGLVAHVACDGDFDHPLDEWLKRRLPGHLVPSIFVRSETLPLTPSGKIDRRALAGQALEVHPGGIRVAPRDLVELRLARIWQDLLPGRAIGIADDFFASGGHSLLAMRLVARIEREFGVRLPVARLFQASTVEALAGAIRASSETAGAAPERALVALQTEGNRPSMFWAHPGGGSALAYGRLASLLGPAQPFYSFQEREAGDEGEPRKTFSEVAADNVAELLALDPQGPYRLGGWSLGGWIAFEMAHALRREGREVLPLLLLDTHLPSPELDPDRVEPAHLLSAFGRQLGLAAPEIERLAADFDGISNRPVAERLAPLLAQAQSENLLPRDLSTAEIRRRFDRFLSGLRVAAQYRPEPYDGLVVLFRPAEAETGDQPPGDDLRRWRELARGGLEVATTPGDHYSMLRDPHVETLAREIALRVAGSEARTSL